MDTRSSNMQEARHTIGIIESGFYTVEDHVWDISDMLRTSCAGTLTYGLDYVYKSYPRPSLALQVHFTSETTTQAARRLYKSGMDVALLNFASARNPGGNFLGGSKAQEEDLARSSGLYDCLLTQEEEFYTPHRAEKSLFYSDRIIYSPKVPFIKEGGVLVPPYLASVITSPAPNTGEILRRFPEADIFPTLKTRASKILHIAAENGHHNLILGAWGCGVFQGNPHDVAKAFFSVLKDSCMFAEVVFAIPDVNIRAIFEAHWRG